MSTKTARTETLWTRCWHVVDTLWWSIPNHPIYPNQIGCRHTPGSLHDLTSIKITLLVDVSHKALNDFQSSTFKQVTDVEIGFLSKRFRDLSLERLAFKIKYYRWKFQSLTLYLMCYALTIAPLTFKQISDKSWICKRKIWKNAEEKRNQNVNNLFFSIQTMR